jgi:hypothetical protein
VPAPLAAASLLLLAALGACSGSARLGSSGSDQSSTTPRLAAVCATCAHHPPPLVAPAGFQHWDTRTIIHGLDAQHSAEDVLAVEGRPVQLRARFAYGTLRKDLEKERVRAEIELADGWLDLGELRTNDDGMVTLPVPLALRDLPSGDYAILFTVEGDATTTRSTLRIRPPGTHVIVFDIDATLTQSNLALAGAAFSEDERLPRPYPGAVELTKAHAKRNEEILYLTARPRFLGGMTRRWLAEWDFAPGSVGFAPSLLDVTTSGGQASFKSAFLEDLIAQGFRLDAGYGNAVCDIEAYRASGLPCTGIYIIGELGGREGTNAVMGSWNEEVARVTALPPIEQPAWAGAPTDDGL